MHPFLNGCCLVRVCFLGFMLSSSSSSVSCSSLSPTALNPNPPYRKMANFRNVSTQSPCSLVYIYIYIYIFFFLNQSGPAVHFSPRNGLKYANVQMITPYQCSTNGFAGNELTFVHLTISVLSGNSQADFRTNTVKHGRVSRSHTHTHTHRVKC